MRTLDKVVSWLLIAFGAVHVSLTRRVHPQLGINAIWFASGGLFMMTIAALNLLRIAYGAAARGVRAVSVAANLVLLLLMLLIAARVPIRGNPQVAVGLALAALLTLFSLFQRSGQPQAGAAQAGK